jgi:hypothetical protein
MVSAPVEKIEEPEEKVIEEPKEEKKTIVCEGVSLEEGIMNCELGKNPIRIENTNASAIDTTIQKKPFYETALIYGLVLLVLILIVLLISRFRESAVKYLEKYYVKSLRIIVVDVIALMTLNAIV